MLGIGFAATRDLVSHLRDSAAGRDLLGRQPTHALAFGISQAGRYLRDHLAQGFNRDETARACSTACSPMSPASAGCSSTPNSASRRARAPGTRTTTSPRWNHPVRRPGALMRGDDSDPKVIETNTSTEYWQKGASLLHTDPHGTRDVALPANVRGYCLPGTQHGGKAGMPRDAGPCTNPRNWHDPMPAIRALLVALDEWVTNGREPPPSRLPRIADGTLVRGRGGGVAEARGAGAAARGERRGRRSATGPIRSRRGTPGRRWCRRWMRTATRSPASGCRTSPCRAAPSPDGTCTRRRCRTGELADRDGTYLAFAATRGEREKAGDPRASLEERYPTPEVHAARVRQVVSELRADRLLLDDDAAAY